MSQRKLSIGLAACMMALLGVVSLPSAHAKTQAALILDSTNLVPAPNSYSEIAPGTSYNLGKNGSLTFVHYGLCKEISVLGGKVTFDAKNFKIDGGKVTKESAQPCPQQLSLAASTAVAGGVVMRGATAIPELAPTSSMLVVGAGASQVVSAKMVDADKNSTELKYDAASHRLSSAAAMKEGTYTLFLQASNGKAIAEWNFKVAAQVKPGTVIVQVQ